MPLRKGSGTASTKPLKVVHETSQSRPIYKLKKKVAFLRFLHSWSKKSIPNHSRSFMVATSAPFQLWHTEGMRSAMARG